MTDLCLTGEELHFLCIYKTKEEMRLRREFLILTLALVALAIAKEEKEKNKEVGTVIGIDLGTTYSW